LLESATTSPSSTTTNSNTNSNGNTSPANESAPIAADDAAVEKTEKSASEAGAQPEDADSGMSVKEREKEKEKELREKIAAKVKARRQEQIEEALKNGPYVYELFAILIHKGSAMGGHYYCYIRV
jgi:uncharacterized membrane protein YqiK